MKRMKKAGFRTLSLILAVLIMCGVMTAGAWNNTLAAQASNAVRPAAIGNLIVSSDENIQVYSQNVGHNNNGRHWIGCHPVWIMGHCYWVDDYDYYYPNQLQVRVFIEGEMQSQTYNKYFAENTTGKMWVDLKSDYRIDKIRYGASYNNSENTNVFTNDSTQIALNCDGPTYLDVYLKYPPTTVTVMHKYGETTITDTQPIVLENGETKAISFLTKIGADDCDFNGYEITPTDTATLVAKSQDQKGLVVTGKTGVRAINVTINYKKADLSDTLNIQKSLGGQIGNSIRDYWIKFDITGQKQTMTPDPLDVVLVLDTSGSMAFDKYGKPTDDTNIQRIKQLKNAVKGNGGFIDKILNSNKDNRIAIVDFSSSVVTHEFSGQKDVLKGIVTNLSAGGGTQTDAGLNNAKQLVDAANQDTNRKSKKIVILFTDGVPGNPSDGSTAYGEAISANYVASDLKDKNNSNIDAMYTISYVADSAVTISSKWQSSLSATAICDTPSGYYNYNGINQYAYTVTPNSDYTAGVTNILGIPVTLTFDRNDPDLPWIWQIKKKDLATCFLKSVASSENNYYDATGAIPLDTIFKNIADSINTVAKNVTVTDEVKNENFHLNIGASGSVQYRSKVTSGAEQQWKNLQYGKTDEATPYYTFTAGAGGRGGTIAFHFKEISAPGVEVRFQQQANNGVYSARTASALMPDLATNESAEITYTDIRGLPKTKTSNAGANYYAYLETPYVYIPNPEDGIVTGKTAQPFGANEQDRIYKIDLSVDQSIAQAEDYSNVTITDTIDSRFVAVDSSGTVLSHNATIDGGTLVIPASGKAYVQWNGQTISANQAWQKTIYLKAKPQFVGGNDVPTNGADSGLTAGNHFSLLFPQPTVNVPIQFTVRNVASTIFNGEEVPNVPNQNNSTALPAAIFDPSSPDVFCGESPTGTFQYTWYDGTEQLGTTDAVGLFPAGIKPESSKNYTLLVDFIPNDSQKGQSVASSPQTGIYDVTVVSGQLTITKELKEPTLKTLDPDQSFLFKIEYTPEGASQVANTFYEVIKTGSGNTGSKTITNLPKGTYQVTELTDWSWRYSVDGNVSSSQQINMLYQTGAVTFTNELTNTNWMDDQDGVTNLFCVYH